MRVKTIRYSLRALDSQLFLRLFLDTSKRRLSLLSYLDNDRRPEKPWLGDVNIDKKEFGIKRSPTLSKKGSSFTVMGNVDPARDALVIHVSASLYEVFTILVVSVVWGFFSVKFFENNVVAYVLGPCLLLLQLLFLVLDYQKTMQLLENYLPFPAEVEAPKTIQQRRYQK